MVQIYPSMSLKIFGNLIKLICHDLEYTEFLTEFRRTCSRVVQTIPSSQKLSQKRDRWIIGAGVHIKVYILNDTEYSMKFLVSLENDSKLFQLVQNCLCMS